MTIGPLSKNFSNYSAHRAEDSESVKSTDVDSNYGYDNSHFFVRGRFDSACFFAPETFSQSEIGSSSVEETSSCSDSWLSESQFPGKICYRSLNDKASVMPSDKHVVASFIEERLAAIPTPTSAKNYAAATFYSDSACSLEKLRSIDQVQKKMGQANLAQKMNYLKGVIDSKIETVNKKDASGALKLIASLLENLSSNLSKQHLLNNVLADKTETNKHAGKLHYFIQIHLLPLIDSVEEGIQSAAKAKSLEDTCTKVLAQMPVIQQKYPGLLKYGEIRGVIALGSALATANAVGGSLPIIGTLINGFLSLNELNKSYRIAILKCYSILLVQLKEDLTELQKAVFSWRMDKVEAENKKANEQAINAAETAKARSARALKVTQETQAAQVVTQHNMKKVQNQTQRFEKRIQICVEESEALNESTQVCLKSAQTCLKEHQVLSRKIQDLTERMNKLSSTLLLSQQSQACFATGNEPSVKQAGIGFISKIRPKSMDLPGVSARYFFPEGISLVG